MRAWVAGVVAVMWQATWGVVIRSVRKENGTGGSSPGCISRPAQSIVRPSSRGGVPVFSRPSGKPSRARVAARPSEGASPTRPAGDLLLADMDEAAQEGAGGDDDARRRGCADRPPVTTPATAPIASEDQILGRRPRRSSGSAARASSCLDRLAIELAVGLGARAAHGRALAAVQHAELDAGAVGRPAHDPVERVDLAHQMPLPSPPIAGLQDISPIVAACDGSAAAVRAPSRAAAAAASEPAWPPPDDDDVPASPWWRNLASGHSGVRSLRARFCFT